LCKCNNAEGAAAVPIPTRGAPLVSSNISAAFAAIPAPSVYRIAPLPTGAGFVSFTCFAAILLI